MSDSFGNRLKALRKKAGLTQEELAHRIGVSNITISRWETDIDMPKTLKIIALAKALGVPEADLLHDSPPIHKGEWVINIKVTQHFENEVIDLTGNISPVANINASEDGCSFVIKAPWSMFVTPDDLQHLFADIMTHHYSTLRANGVSVGAIPDIPAKKKRGKK